MKSLSDAFERRWFYVGALVLGGLYGFGGLVHFGNILGLGELKWSDAPIAWKVGDVVWGALDLMAVGGIILKLPIGLIALALAAISQVVIYGFFPQLFALTEAHHETLREMVYFNGIVLLVLGGAVFVVVGTRNS